MTGPHDRNLGPQCAAILGLPVSRRRCSNHAAEGETLCGVHAEWLSERAAIRQFLGGFTREESDRLAIDDLARSEQ